MNSEVIEIPSSIIAEQKNADDDPFLLSLITQALENIGQDKNKASGFIKILQSEWYFSVADVLLAIEDGHMWADVKIPGRLKLELKSLILRSPVMKSSDRVRNGNVKTANSSWLRYFSKEYNCFYFYNAVSQETQWEEPEGVVQCTDHIFDNSDPKGGDLSTLASVSSGEKILADAYSSIEILPHHPVALMKPPPTHLDCDSVFKLPIAISNDGAIPSQSHEALKSAPEIAFESPQSPANTADSELVKRLKEMGFEESQAEDALRKSSNRLSVATTYLIKKNKFFS